MCVCVVKFEFFINIYGKPRKTQPFKSARFRHIFLHKISFDNEVNWSQSTKMYKNRDDFAHFQSTLSMYH